MTKIINNPPPFTFDQKDGEIESNTCLLMSLLNSANFSYICDDGKTYYIDANQLIYNWKKYNPDKSLKRSTGPTIKVIPTRPGVLTNRDSIFIYKYLSGAAYFTIDITPDKFNKKVQDITFVLPLTTQSTQTIKNKTTFEQQNNDPVDCTATVKINHTFLEDAGPGPITLNSILALLDKGPIRFAHNNPTVAQQLACRLPSGQGCGPYDSEGYLQIVLQDDDVVATPDRSRDRFAHAFILIGFEKISATRIKLYCIDSYGTINKKFTIECYFDENKYNETVFLPLVPGASRIQFVVQEIDTACCEEVVPEPSPS